MFFKKINKRRFILRGLSCLGLATLECSLKAQSSSLETIQADTNVITIVTISSPTDTVWILEESTDIINWISVPPARVVNRVALGSGQIQWKIISTNQSTFFRMKLATATMNLGNVSFQIPVEQTLLEAMTNLKLSSTSSFTFTSELLSLGQFVTSINGVTSPKWVFSVNGQEELATGISSYVIKSSDIITWLITT